MFTDSWLSSIVFFVVHTASCSPRAVYIAYLSKLCTLLEVTHEFTISNQTSVLLEGLILLSLIVLYATNDHCMYTLS